MPSNGSKIKSRIRRCVELVSTSGFITVMSRLMASVIVPPRLGWTDAALSGIVSAQTAKPRTANRFIRRSPSIYRERSLFEHFFHQLPDSFPGLPLIFPVAAVNRVGYARTRYRAFLDERLVDVSAQRVVELGAGQGFHAVARGHPIQEYACRVWMRSLVDERNVSRSGRQVSRSIRDVIQLADR